jgi:hypothetical protein
MEGLPNLEKRKTAYFTTNESQLSVIDKKQENSCNKKVIITRCLKYPCPRTYTDTISESFLILCKDPKHEIPRANPGGGGFKNYNKGNRALAKVWHLEANAAEEPSTQEVTQGDAL